MSTGDRTADAVTARRKRLGLTQVALADLTGVSRGTVRNVEAGEVEPNPQTARALDEVLGWAPGSVRNLAQGQPAAEVLPVETLAPLLQGIHTLLGFDESHEWARGQLGSLRGIVASADPDGLLDTDTTKTMSMFIERAHLTLDPWSEQEDEVRGRMLDRFLEHSVTRRLAGTALPTFAPGDFVSHREFGLGRLVRLRRTQSGQERADINFENHGAKRLNLAAAAGLLTKVPHPYPSLANPYPSMANPAETPAEDPDDDLPEEIRELLSDGTVMDFEQYYPAGSSTLSVAVVLLKRSTGPLSKADRRYVAELFERLPAALDHVDPLGPPDPLPE